MLDLSEEFDEENIATCVKYFKVLWSCPNCPSNIVMVTLTLYNFILVAETSQEDQFCRNTAFLTVQEEKGEGVEQMREKEMGEGKCALRAMRVNTREERTICSEV